VSLSANPASPVDGGSPSRFHVERARPAVSNQHRSANMSLLSLTALLLVAIPTLGAGAQFPSADSSTSPDGRWRVACKSPEDNSGHLLLLKRIGGASVELRRFGRHCDTLWSPDSSHLAVTDWLGSNMSDVFIYSVTNSVTGKSVGDLFPRGAIPEAELRGHCYFEATKWIDPHHLWVRVFGHTDEAHAHSFEHSYVFDLWSGHFEKVSNKAPNKPHAANSRPGSRGRFGSFGVAAVADEERYCLRGRATP
jgi:hypothetical protein